jgi:tripartite-type tricarboxylate transporter receptor subunit TctC
VTSVNFSSLAFAAVVLALAAAFAAAQEAYPSRPIRLIMPTPPGGGTDVLGRRLAELVEPILGQKVLVENKPGASGTIGIAQTVQAKPDGYTIGAIWNGAVTTTPHTLQLPSSSMISPTWPLPKPC